MVDFETLEDFYQRIPNGWQQALPANNAGSGHFNVIRRIGSCVRSPFSRRDFYKVTLLIGGGIMHFSDKSVTINQPALVFSGPAEPSAWESGPETQRGWFCLFTQEFAESREYKSMLQDYPYFQQGARHILPLDDSQIDLLSAIYTKMAAELESAYPYKYDLLRSHLHILLHEALKIGSSGLPDAHVNAAARTATQFLQLLERQFPVDSPDQQLQLKTANDYAQCLSMHINHLNRSVKTTTGKTTTQHIAERVLKEAQALLKHSDWNITQIGNALGFDEPAYFVNFFKKHTGKAPGLTRVAG